MLVGNGIPWVMIADSRATTGSFLSIAFWTSGEIYTEWLDEENNLGLIGVRKSEINKYQYQTLYNKVIRTVVEFSLCVIDILIKFVD